MSLHFYLDSASNTSDEIVPMVMGPSVYDSLNLETYAYMELLFLGKKMFFKRMLSLFLKHSFFWSISCVCTYYVCISDSENA